MEEAVEELRSYIRWWDWGYYDCMRRKVPDYGAGAPDSYDDGYTAGLKRLEKKHDRYIAALAAQQEGYNKEWEWFNARQS